LATQKSHPSTPGRTSMSGPTQTLLIESEDARVHCAVLNVRPDTDHTPPPDPHTHRHAAVRQKVGPDTRSQHPVPRMARSLRTQQRAYEPNPTVRLPSTHTRRHAVLGARDAGRPNWSAFHPRAPPQTPATRRD